MTEAPVALSPTASQEVADAQDTPSSVPTPEGSDCCDQVEPSNKSAAPVVPAAPTASQEVADAQDTPSSVPTPEGRDCSDQVEPSNKSAIADEAAAVSPTASQKF